MTDYSNILKAVQNQSQPAVSPTLSTAQQVENYSVFSDLMKQGVYLPDMIKRIDDLEKKVNDLDRKPSVDPALFTVMEDAVKDDQAVKDAYGKMVTAKNDAIRKLVMNDPDFKAAYDAYRQAVQTAYVGRK